MEHKSVNEDSIIESTVHYIISYLEHNVSLLDSKTQKLICALSGGGSPKALYPVLSHKMSEHIARRLILIQVDERVVEATHEDSNCNLITSTMKDLLSKGTTFLPVPVYLNDPHSIAVEYNSMLTELFETTARTHKTIAFLGAGMDGHTASIFPSQEDDRAMAKY